MRQGRRPGQHISRRNALKIVGAGVVGSALASTPGGAGRHFPPEERTEWGEKSGLGYGEIETFVTNDRAGDPQFVGVYFTTTALQGLALGDGDIHTAERELHLDFPEGTPFTFALVDWNADGHPPEEVYDVPHLDFHAYLVDEGTVADIPGGPAQYSLPDERKPTDYIRPPTVDTDDDGEPDEPLVEEGMGEHLVDPSAREFSGEAFTHTFIWGAWDLDDDGEGVPIFYEPMVTREYLLDRVGAEDDVVAGIRMPDAFAEAGVYPTRHVIRYLDDQDAFAVTLESFETFPATGE